MHSKEDMTPHRYGLPKMRKAALSRLARAEAFEAAEWPGTAIKIVGDRKLDLADFRNGETRVFSLLGDTKIVDL